MRLKEGREKQLLFRRLIDKSVKLDRKWVSVQACLVDEAVDNLHFVYIST